MHDSILKTVEKRRDELLEKLRKNPSFIEMMQLNAFIEQHNKTPQQRGAETRAKKKPERKSPKSPLLKIKHGNRLVTVHNTVMEVLKSNKEMMASIEEVWDELYENVGIKLPKRQAGTMLRNYLQLYLKAHRDLGHNFVFLDKNGEPKVGRGKNKVATIKLVVDKKPDPKKHEHEAA